MPSTQSDFHQFRYRPLVPTWISWPGLVALVLAASLTASDTDDGFYLCVFRRCTGGYCPGCGATRSIGHLVRANPAAAWNSHPWVVLGATQLAAATLLWLVCGPKLIDKIRNNVVPLAVFNALLIVAIWGVRLSQGAIPAPWD